MFGNAIGGYVVVVDFRLQFGRRTSPGFWGLMTLELGHAHTHSTFLDAAVSHKGLSASRVCGIPRCRGGRLALSFLIVGSFPGAATPRVVC